MLVALFNLIIHVFLRIRFVGFVSTVPCCTVSFLQPDACNHAMANILPNWKHSVWSRVFKRAKWENIEIILNSPRSNQKGYKPS